MIDNDFRIDTKIVGVTFENEDGVPIQSILPKLKNGDGLFFIRDYSNNYDKNAIKVYCKEGHIGHINKDLAAEIIPFLSDNENFELEGAIIEITGGNDKTYGCNIRIWVQDKSELFFEDISSSSESETLISVPTESNVSDTEIILKSLGVIIAAIFAGIICWCILAKLLWFFYVIALGAFGFATYMIYMIIRILTISKK